MPAGLTAGELAYTAYCDSREWKAFNGDALPAFDALKEKSPDIAQAWEAAGTAAQIPVRLALSALVGESDAEALRGMAEVIEAADVPAADRRAMLNAIHVLLNP